MQYILPPYKSRSHIPSRRPAGRDKRFLALPFVISFLASFFISNLTPAFAQTSEEKNFLLMYFKEEELTVESPTRSPQPVAKTAENITVVTASDIELMHAHTLADVLNTVTGVEVFMDGGPGSTAVASIHGSEAMHVTVVIDGVVLNDLADSLAELGMIPVQNIQKIEVIKGPASSAWGSSLGGVVNVITKAGKSDNQGGMFSASYGKKNTADVREEARGKQGAFGYYVTAGVLKTDGLTPSFDVSEYNAYTKLSYDLTDRTGILFTFGYANTSRGDGEDDVSDIYFGVPSELLYSTLAVNSRLSSNLDLTVSARRIDHTYGAELSQLSTGSVFERDIAEDTGYGSSAKLTWKDSSQTLVLGSDYDEKFMTSTTVLNGEQGIKKWAVYANDTISLNDITITPGARYDHTSTNGAFTSPSLGIAYALGNNTILRVYGAKGFNIPPLAATFASTIFADPNPDIKMERVTSYQAGAETASLKYVWMKVSLFWNEIRDVIAQATSPLDPNKFIYVNAGRQRRRGVEYELRTTPVYNTSVSVGVEFTEATDLDTGQKVQNIPSRVYNIGIRYDDLESFKALLFGHYVDFNPDSIYNGTSGTYVYDLHVIKKIYDRKDASLEAFADAHNLFNRPQYPQDIYVNPSRWYEGGIRFKF